jgi:hypothetical protein
MLDDDDDDDDDNNNNNTVHYLFINVLAQQHIHLTNDKTLANCGKTRAYHVV